MRYKQIGNLSAAQFQRATGVKRNTFNQMLLAVGSHHQQRSHNRGRPSRMCIEDQLLLMLMYYREYRTFLHISIAYEISEAQCWRIIRKMEDILIKSQLFHLPGKKKLVDNEMNWEVVVIDVGESPIERPKKNSAGIIQEKRNDIP